MWMVQPSGSKDSIINHIVWDFLHLALFLFMFLAWDGSAAAGRINTVRVGNSGTLDLCVWVGGDAAAVGLCMHFIRHNSCSCSTPSACFTFWLLKLQLLLIGCCCCCSLGLTTKHVRGIFLPDISGPGSQVVQIRVLLGSCITLAGGHLTV